MKEYLRKLPPIHELQQTEAFKQLATELSTEKLTEWLQEGVDLIRNQLIKGTWQGELSEKDLQDSVLSYTKTKMEHFQSYKLERIINATGTILHTNLGRARLSKKAVEQVIMAASNYSNLEYNISTGKRGSRHDLIEEVIQEVTGAEAAMVVNNNAAAVYLILKAFAKEKEVIVSRGQLVEIGGSFRVSSIMEESGASLVEVGTTNKTHLKDYKEAITEHTAMIMKVHTSNFKTIGFTAEVSVDDLAGVIKEEENVILYEDLGSGAIYDFRQHHIGEEPTVKEVLDKGVDIVSFSGDKLLGGPQAGIIAGKKELINQLKKHQLARVLRVDKMTLAALEATIKLYVIGEDAIKGIPTVASILDNVHAVKEKAKSFINGITNKIWDLHLVEGTSKIGGGTMPDVEVPTYLVQIKHENKHAQKTADILRLGSPSIVCRLKDDAILLDFRTIHLDELEELVKVFNDFH
ncbi:L-seryl-tRNA(Sec) selenium transferase [Bacillus sp. FJAT-45350]|uniref:L-seryl-tRNA(Sec) selenium transferase n=1 Tax=Bacillus sp. FJAT-45350 TaxID=2011014 RepID=UPI000BB6CCB9|nr:L-seryl-tRNA(Sec) selenium transferase [Bacillus sp. FJAT-45350]